MNWIFTAARFFTNPLESKHEQKIREKNTQLFNFTKVSATFDPLQLGNHAGIILCGFL